MKLSVKRLKNGFANTFIRKHLTSLLGLKITQNVFVRGCVTVFARKLHMVALSIQILQWT